MQTPYILALLVTAGIALAVLLPRSSQLPSNGVGEAWLKSYLDLRENTLRQAVANASSCVKGSGPSEVVLAMIPWELDPGDTPLPGVMFPDAAVILGYRALDLPTVTASQFLELADGEVASLDKSGEEGVAVVSADTGLTQIDIGLGPCARGTLVAAFGSEKEGIWHLFAGDALFATTDETALEREAARTFPAWAQCMDDSGFALSTPRDAWIQSKNKPNEYAVALADSRCRQSSELNNAISRQVLVDAVAQVNARSDFRDHIDFFLARRGGERGAR